MALNGRQLLEYAEDNSLLAGGQTRLTVVRGWGKSRVTAGVARKQSVPAKHRNGAGRTTEDSGEFTPGLGGLS